MAFPAAKIDADSRPSCLSPEALQHFRFREQQVMQLDIDLERKRQHAMHAVNQITRTPEMLPESPRQRHSKAPCASACACSATAAPNFRKNSCTTLVDSHNTRCGSNSDSESTGIRRATTAGYRPSSFNSVEELRCDCLEALAGDSKADTGVTKQHAKESVQIREAILKDPYVACADVGKSVREEYSAVFVPTREAAEKNVCGVSGSCKDAALAAALDSQHSRVVVLQQELTTRLQETQTLSEELHKCESRNHVLETENETLKRKIDQLAVQAERAKHVHEETCSRLEVLEKTATELRAENEKLATSSEKSISDLKLKEAHLQRATEEAASLRELLKDFKNKNKDSSTFLHKECQKLGCENKRLLSQRNELVQGFKKQMRLIDVLKKQKAHMEAARLLSFSEDEFLRILRIDESDGMN